MVDVYWFLKQILICKTLFFPKFGTCICLFFNNFVWWNVVLQLNVDTGVETEFVFPEGMFVQEPQYIARPAAVEEDDGVILAQGVDGRKNKGDDL